MRSPVRRDLSSSAPLPLARLLVGARNARTPLEQHQSAYYAWEATLKLMASTCLVAYAELEGRDPGLDERLHDLVRPSLGHWLQLLRLLLPALVQAGGQEFQALHRLLGGEPREDLPRLAGLWSRLRRTLEQRHEARSTVQVGELLDHLVRYRNRELGHGALGQGSTARYSEMASALLAGVTELLEHVNVLAGRRLVFVEQVSRQSDGRWSFSALELITESPRRIPRNIVNQDDWERLPHPNRVYLLGEEGGDSRSATAIVPLHPLLLYSADDDRTYFLNSRRGRARADYLDYVSGDVRTGVEITCDPRALLAHLLDVPVAGGRPDARGENAHAVMNDAHLESSDKLQGAATRRIGEYQVLAKLGVGGMGDVYRAWQPSLGREVALKCMRRLGDPVSEARFMREIRVLGRVEHPNLVRIFTSGSDGHRWFYAMEIIEGATLDSLLVGLVGAEQVPIQVSSETWTSALTQALERTRQRERSLSEAEGIVSTDRGDATGQGGGTDDAFARANCTGSVPLLTERYVDRVAVLVEQVAGAAHALHEAGIIHRDIKPSNVMIDAAGMHATLMDLGLAKLDEEPGRRLTETRQFVGTLRYSSPEQLIAAGAIDRRSDVYSLGVVLWELLALRPLYDASECVSAPDLMHRIQFDEPEPLRRLNRAIPVDLEAIVMKCLAKNPKLRYESAAALQEDLSRWRAGDAVVARRRTTLYVLQRAVFRHRRSILAGALAVVLMVAAAMWGGKDGGNAIENLRLKEVAAIVEGVRSRPPGVIYAAEANRVEVERLEREDLSGFDVMETLKVWDLREWVPLPPDALDKPGSPVVVRVERKLIKREPVDELRLDAITSGYDVYLRTISHPTRAVVRAARKTESLGGRPMKARQLAIDVSNVPVGTPFSVDLQATYWNAFQTPEQRWGGAIVTGNPLKVSFLAIFPTERPFKSFQLEVAERGGARVTPFESERVMHADKDAGYIFWEIVQPRANHVYRIRWEW